MPRALTVVGWAVCAIGISAVTVYLDGEAIGDAELGLPREDVGNEHRHIPMARYAGFRLVRTFADVPAGEHGIRVVLRNGLDDVQRRGPHCPDRACRTAAAATETSSPRSSAWRSTRPPWQPSVAVEPITGRLTIEGWALARSGHQRHRGAAGRPAARRRALWPGRVRTSGSAFPDWVDSLRSGYRIPLPAAQPAQRRARRAAQCAGARRRIPGAPLQHHGAEVRGVRGRHDHPPAHDAGGGGRRADVLDGLAHRPGFRLILRAGVGARYRLRCLRRWDRCGRRSIVTGGWRSCPADTDHRRAVRALIAEAATIWPNGSTCSIRSDRHHSISPSAIRGPVTTCAGRLASARAIELGCDALLQIATGQRPASRRRHALRGRSQAQPGKP